MRKTLCLMAFGLVVAGSVAAAAQQATPQIQNGKVETRRAAAIDREIAAAAPTNASDPAWVAWRTPMVPGDRDMCSWYSDRYSTMRGMYLDEGSVFVTTTGVADNQRQPIAQPKGPIPLEGGTSLVILARVVGGRVERLRTVGDDCPMDAGGRTVNWLEGVTPAESIRYLAQLAEIGPTDRTMYRTIGRLLSRPFAQSGITRTRLLMLRSIASPRGIATRAYAARPRARSFHSEARTAS